MAETIVLPSSTIVSDTPHIKVEVHIKFRFLGRDLLKVEKTEIASLPNEVAFVAKLLGLKTLFNYNDHGVQVIVSLLPNG